MEMTVEDGIDSLTMAGLAERCDAAVGALYRYFPGKDALITALQVRAIQAMHASLDTRLSLADGPRERLDVVMRSWHAFADDSPALHGLVAGSLNDPRRLLSDQQAVEVDQALQPLLDRCAEVLTRAATEGIISSGNAQLRVHILWAAVHGAWTLGKRDPRLPPELQRNQVLDAVCTTLLAAWAT